MKNAAVPRSHPVLTMNTHENYLKSQTKLLSTYLHEQLHWHVIINGKVSYGQFMRRVKAEFPDVKVGGAQGSSDEEGTLNHIVVCYLEYLALSELIGQPEAKNNLASNHYYKWVYQTVLDPKNKGKLDALVNEFGLTWSAAG
ncbi:MAG: hypothetical protein U5L02_18105 [Rheinheimera sp.]|nr:hypothetical protein [Rheinheimera sp.]